MPILDTDIDEAKKMFEVNVFAIMTVTQAFAPLLVACEGAIVNIGSISGIAPLFFQGMYNASKAAANHLTDQLRLEMSPFNVKCILVLTGGVKTKFLDNRPRAKLPNHSLYSPAKEEVEMSLAGEGLEKYQMDVDQYADTVVNNALKKNPSTHLIAGGQATMVWAVSKFLWHTIWVSPLPLATRRPMLTLSTGPSLTLG